MRRFAAGIRVVNFLIILTIWLRWTPAGAQENGAWPANLTSRIPKRPRSALTGSQFVDLVSKMDEHQR